MALALGQAQDLLRVLEEDVVVGVAAVEVEEAEVERGGARRLARLVRPCEAASSKRGRAGADIGSSDGEEDGDAGDQQRLREALDDGVDQGAEVGLGVEAAAEVDQGLAVVEALLIEDAVDAGLDHALERIEDEAGDDDGGQQAPDAEGCGSAGVDDLGG